MGFHPKVTIAIPVFNGGDLLKAALESALTQSYDNLEVLAVDDGSTDGSLQSLQELAGERLRLIIHERNQGIEAAWNSCLASATGQFLILLPQDDRLLPGAVQARVSHIQRNPGFAIYFGPRWIINAGGQRVMLRGAGLAEGPVESREVVSKCLLSGMNHIGDPASVTISLAHARQLSQGFSGRWPWVIDLEYWFRLLSLGGGSFLAEPTSEFRLSRGALSYRLKSEQTRQFQEFSNAVRERFMVPRWKVWVGGLVGTAAQLLRNALYLVHSRS